MNAGVEDLVAIPQAAPLKGASVTDMPTPAQYRFGQCVPCLGRPTLVAPGLGYIRADGKLVSIPTCEDHHKALVRYVHQVAMRADLANAAERV